MKLFGFKNFDELLAFHCAPVLAGIKPSNLISLLSDDGEEIDVLLADYNMQFAAKGLVFRRLCACTKRALVFVYNEKDLTALVRQPRYRAYLISAGYGVQATLEEDLNCLEHHLSCKKEFPHEIGVFLGYPLEDILGFALNRGRNCKYSGYWKVYGDVQQARLLFAAYERCRDFILKKLAEGMPLKAAVAAL